MEFHEIQKKTIWKISNIRNSRNSRNYNFAKISNFFFWKDSFSNRKIRKLEILEFLSLEKLEKLEFLEFLYLEKLVFLEILEIPIGNSRNSRISSVNHRNIGSFNPFYVIY